MTARMRPRPVVTTRPRARQFGPHDVRLGLAKQFLPRSDVVHAELVGHGTRDGEQARLVAEQARNPVLERPDGRVLAVDVVAGLGHRHRGEHRAGRAGHRVAAQVDRHGTNSKD